MHYVTEIQPPACRQQSSNQQPTIHTIPETDYASMLPTSLLYRCLLAPEICSDPIPRTSMMHAQPKSIRTTTENNSAIEVDQARFSHFRPNFKQLLQAMFADALIGRVSSLARDELDIRSSDILPAAPTAGVRAEEHTCPVGMEVWDRRL